MVPFVNFSFTTAVSDSTVTPGEVGLIGVFQCNLWYKCLDSKIKVQILFYSVIFILYFLCELLRSCNTFSVKSVKIIWVNFNDSVILKISM